MPAADLLDFQEHRHTFEHPVRFRRVEEEKALMPSVDRIDSDGHYEDGNLQIVSRFINARKSDSDDEEFRRLSVSVGGDEIPNPSTIS